MSIDVNSDIRSKYFTGQTDMDESLSDFQEAKKSCKGPKPALKPAKPKAKKVTKRSKGQRDIRTVLKGKRNELVSYSKEFDTVCKKSGLDVDSEQLQLAIALSKSLQTESNIPETSQALSSQQRVAKIRKTLQEYGFKVPEAKIAVSRKTKKFRKNYKLLTATEEEKHQNITEKYTRILFEKLDHSKLEQDNSNDQESNVRVFYIASNIPYECMKDNEIFYVDNLVDKSVTNGSLLRDWSEIPGRPESPKHIDTYIMNFKDIDCSQEDLDIILSGPSKSVKDIFASKEIEYKKSHKECVVPKINIEDEEKIVSDDGMESPNKTIMSPIKQSTLKSPSKDVIGTETSNTLTLPQQCRSCSPDIFDDELSSIMETTKPLVLLSQEHKTKVFSQEIMDLTQCANISLQNSEKDNQLSQNATERRSNDLMEITECIVSSSHPIGEDFKEKSLTQSSEEKCKVIEGLDINIDNVDNVSKNLSNAVQNTTSLSQNITDEQQITILSNHPNKDLHQNDKDYIDLTQSSNDDDIQTPDKIQMNLTQLSNSKDNSLPFVGVPNSLSQASLDDTPRVDKDKYIHKGKRKAKKSIFRNEAESQVFDSTQAPDTLEYNPSHVEKTKSYSNSFFEDFFHNHSKNTENSKEIADTDVSKGRDASHYKSRVNNDEIDLTQDSSTSEEILLSQRPNTVLNKLPNNSSLGKQDDVSIDYDEIIKENSFGKRKYFQEIEIDNVSDNYASSGSDMHNVKKKKCDNESFKYTKNNKSLTQQSDSSKSKIYNVDDDNDSNFNSSQNSEVFQLSDKELDYSLHKSRRDFSRNNLNFGGTSILGIVYGYESYRKSLSEEGWPSTENKNDTVENSFLPEVYIKKNEISIKETTQLEFDTDGVSPIKVQEVLKSSNGIINIKTPRNSEYIIKTVDVTPMADYAAMSTPQLNEELDKYGLRPFKRKRAIQMLTHLYNQTHPTIQEAEDQPSPAKKPRTNIYSNDYTPRRLITSFENSPPTHRTNCSKTPVKSPRKIVSMKPQTTTCTQDSSPKRIISLPENSPSKLVTGHLKSPRKFFYKKRTPYGIKELTSPRKLYELERAKAIGSGLSCNRQDEFERDSNKFSGPSSTKIDEIRGITDVCVYEVTNEVAIVRKVRCRHEDWVFQKREKAKVHSCRVPLHIAFHNYVSSRRSLREAILKYEPVNIDVIHKDLVGYGHRYDPKDLLKYLDKQCITVKTTDNNARNNK